MNTQILNREIRGDIISSGAIVGTLCFVDFKEILSSNKTKIKHEEIENEILRFEKETCAIISELKESVKILRNDSFFEEADIIKTHIMMLDDEEFRKNVHKKIKENKFAAEIALEHVLQDMVEVLENSESMLFSQRAVDLKDIEMRLKKKLIKEDSAIFSELLKNIKDPVVAVKELLPSMILEAKSRGVRGFIVRQGTSFSHAAILAKSFGLPVLKIENFNNFGIRNNQRILIDAINGKIVIDPSEDTAIYAEMATRETDAAIDEKLLPAKLWINMVDPLQIKEEDLINISGIGLYRTEVFFMKNREDFPDEDEQFAVYASLFKKCKNRPVTIRTLDIGGDKILPYFSLGPQENPYLGFRAHRIYRFHPEIFITQIRAILRAGLGINNLRILYPMIETVEDLWFVQELVKKAKLSLDEDGIKYNDNFKQGVLIEVPSAVWSLSDLLHHVDFISVGTNDLFQYIFAIDRNNANVYNAYQPESPVALQILKKIIDITTELNTPVSICGEIASDANYLPLLVGLGYINLSVDSHSIPALKKHLLSLNVLECKKLVEKCLKMKRAKEVMGALDEFNSFDRDGHIHHSRNNAEFVDPVCKMVVNAEGNKWVASREGKKYYFCRKECRDTFIRGGAK